MMGQHWYFIGIGGCGMSALAKIHLEMGDRVSGSDLTGEEKSPELTRLGAVIHRGHNAAHLLDSPDVVVYSTAIRPDNPEMIRARSLGIPLMHRSQCLAGLTALQETISVAGAHGKTTTSSMLSTILMDCGYDPTAVVGGSMDILGGNGRLGRGRYLVAEADESDGSFLNLKTAIPLITNIEDDHMDHYGSMEAIVEAFRTFVRQADSPGILNTDCPVTRSLSGERPGTVTYGLKGTPDYQAVNLRYGEGWNSADVLWKGKYLTGIRIHMPGDHNISNALGALACACSLGADPQQVSASLEGYRGVGRRYQLVGEFNGIRVVDDYAHHPTEIASLLAGARQTGPARLVVVFQPHRYTRTRQFLDEFAEVLKAADLCLITDIYSAGEDPLEGISSGTLARRAASSRVIHSGSLEETLTRLRSELRPGDLVLTIGAGSITGLGPELIKGK